MTTTSPHEPPAEPAWQALDPQTEVAATSEAPDRPLRSAFAPAPDAGWRADAPGAQTLRVRFAQPRRLARIGLCFVEADVARTQEFVLRWSPDDGRSFREVVRQQWNFSPEGSTREDEDYRVDLDGVTRLELHVIPSTNGGEARASLAAWRMA